MNVAIFKRETGFGYRILDTLCRVAVSGSPVAKAWAAGRLQGIDGRCAGLLVAGT